MKRASALLLVGILLVAGGCSSSNPSGPGQAANAADAAGSAAPPPALTMEIAKPLVIQYVEGTTPLKEFSRFLRMRPNSNTASPTVMVEYLRIDSYDSSKQCYPVDADLVMAKKMPDGNVHKLEGDGIKGFGFPPIPGTWKLAFKSSGNGRWQVEVRK